MCSCTVMPDIPVLLHQVEEIKPRLIFTVGGLGFNKGPPLFIQILVQGGTEGQRGKGTEGQRGKGTEGQRHIGAEAQRGKGAKAQRNEKSNKSTEGLNHAGCDRSADGNRSVDTCW